MGGFVAWHLKYSNVVDKTQPDPIYGEWELVDIISQYFVQLDADAPGLMGLADASVY